MNNLHFEDIDFKALREWQAEKGQERCLTIKFGDVNNRDKINIWAYDFGIEAGVFLKVGDTEEVRSLTRTIVENKKQKLLDSVAELTKLQEKYEDEANE